MFHSLLASGRAKRWAASHLTLLQFYRLVYTLFALVTFSIVVYFEATLPSPFMLGPSFKIIGYPMAIMGLTLMIICIKKYFVGLSGLKSILKNQPQTADLKVDGVHRRVRHPLYLGTFIFIWGLFFIIPHLSLLLSNGIIHLYTLIGIRFEEKKLIETFGDQYRCYQREVPKLIPWMKHKPKKTI